MLFIKPTYTRLRQLCHSIYAVKRPKRRAKARQYRPRHPAEGYMLQMDGSTHLWFGDKKSCIIAGIDDATSDIPYGEFFDSEGLFGTMRVLRKIIEKKGIPWVLYLDRANWFAGWKPSGRPGGAQTGTPLISNLRPLGPNFLRILRG